MSLLAIQRPAVSEAVAGRSVILPAFGCTSSPACEHAPTLSAPSDLPTFVAVFHSGAPPAPGASSQAPPESGKERQDQFSRCRSRLGWRLAPTSRDS
jgi:hypothetical protein